MSERIEELSKRITAQLQKAPTRIPAPIVDLILAEETARILAEELKPEKFRPKTLGPETHTIKRAFDILDSVKPGKINELVITTTDSDFSVIMRIDSMQMRKTFTELQNISPHTPAIDAYQDEGNYVLRLQNWSWRSKGLVRLIPTASLTFEVFMRYEERKE